MQRTIVDSLLPNSSERNLPIFFSFRSLNNSQMLYPHIFRPTCFETYNRSLFQDHLKSHSLCSTRWYVYQSDIKMKSNGMWNVNVVYTNKVYCDKDMTRRNNFESLSSNTRGQRWMQMSYRTEAYRISITSSRNSADRNVAVALTCTLLCYWWKSFTIDSSH